MDLSEQSERMQSFYNLKHDPFGAIVDSMVFSGSGGRYEIAETIRHLMSYSHQDSLIVAQSGAGKRTLALQVLKLLDEQWRVAWIDGNDIESVSELLKELVGQFGLGLKVDEESTSLTQKISDTVASRYEQEESFLIVVQYADRLPTEVLSTLHDIRQSASDIDSRIRQLWLSDSWEQLTRQLPQEEWYVHPLDRFTDQDAEQYLKDRMIAAGNVAELPFQSKDIARLNQLSDGNPDKLNQLARDYLISSTFKTTEKKQSFPLTHVFAGLGALSLVVVAFLYQVSEKNSDVVATPLTPSVDMTTVEKKLADAVAKVEAKQSVVDPAVETEETIEVDQQPDDNAIDLTEVGTIKVEEAKPENPQVAQIVEAPSENKAVENVPDRLSETAKDSEFTMQLIGVREKVKLNPLIEQFNSDALIDVIETTHQGKPWFILIYGQYDSKADAAKAVSELPSELGINEPWIRSFASIKAQK